MLSEVKRVYHFVELHYGLDDLHHRRLKIAELSKLNDPFEFLGMNLKDPVIRNAVREMKKELSKNTGILCFSRSWRNPVLWSHYAGKHTGLCLGFDIPSEYLVSVKYSSKRFSVDKSQLLEAACANQESIQRLLSFKYSHWRYENEIRSFLSLEDIEPQTCLYFAEFSDHLRLAEVILGAETAIKESTLMDALGDLGPLCQGSCRALLF